MLRIPWTAKRTSISILDQLRINTGLSTLCCEKILSYFGHIARRLPSNMEKLILVGEAVIPHWELELDFTFTKPSSNPSTHVNVTCFNGEGKHREETGMPESSTLCSQSNAPREEITVAQFVSPWKLTMGLIRRLRVSQQAMERAMLGVSLRDQIRNEEIRRRTKVNINVGSTKVLEWQSRTGKRSVGRPPTRWTYDIKRGEGSRWTQAA
ncbi:jg24424 [Pararge aegeria aegeria]|uniref:Jg24424 protein n=1 Tax=Pararge aegeria aegeria TaxID=348720 RepID=A0A8S4S2D6_9NEOP|nr:jg24424 [Pararge aegeria aegeria]